jgi:hypothetical protein
MPDMPGISDEAMRERMAMAQKRFMDAGMPADQVGDIVLDAIRTKRFYIFTHPEGKKGVQDRMEDILNERPPRLREMMGGGGVGQ